MELLFYPLIDGIVQIFYVAALDARLQGVVVERHIFHL